MIQVSRNGRRMAASSHDPFEVFEFARAAVQRGERCRINVRWNHSYHDACFFPFAVFGPAVRKPMTAAEVEATIERIGAEIIRRFQHSRKNSE